jgi:hypothetical protein
MADVGAAGNQWRENFRGSCRAYGKRYRTINYIGVSMYVVIKDLTDTVSTKRRTRLRRNDKATVAPYHTSK